MNDKRLADLFEFIQNTWGPSVAWMAEKDVFETWKVALRNQDDRLVELAVSDLMRSPTRNQAWPINLAEITTECAKLRRHYESMGVRFDGR